MEANLMTRKRYQAKENQSARTTKQSQTFATWKRASFVSPPLAIQDSILYQTTLTMSILEHIYS
jgi:hypothetical protein